MSYAQNGLLFARFFCMKNLHSSKGFQCTDQLCYNGGYAYQFELHQRLPGVNKKKIT